MQTRRIFLSHTGAAIAAGTSAAGAQNAPKGGGEAVDARGFLAKRIYTRTEVDDWLGGRDFRFAKYDSELGWLLQTARWAKGMDGSTWETNFSQDKHHERRMIAYADRRCRVNTYGDSFTHGDQVNDGETWQEALASHLREPIRNFGIGAFSVYQAYLRMLREEARAPGDLVILNVFGDDHYRNLDAWRNISSPRDYRFLSPSLPHLRVNLSTGECEQRGNPCPTKESVYRLCELDWVEERFRGDFALGIMLAQANARTGHEERAFEILHETARAHGLNEDLKGAGTALEAAQKLRTRAALLASMQIVRWAEDFVRKNKKKRLYVLSFWGAQVAQRVKTGTRFDQPFVDFLNREKLPYVDLMSAHVAESSQFSSGIDEYTKRYWIGHYNPRGNLFAAMAIKDKLVAMLDPKPPAYLPL